MSGNREDRKRDRFGWLIRRINELRQSLKPLGEETEKLLRRLKSEGCEIYGAIEDRGIVISIWVQSSSALAAPNDDGRDRGPLSTVEHLLTHICRLNYWNQGPILRRHSVVIDGDQLRTDIASICPMISRLVKRLDESSYVHGIATLNDHLYVLCHQPNVLRVYQSTTDLDAFGFQREIPLWPIVEPWDMASSHRYNRLYITDSHNRCVWKVQDGSQVVTWLQHVSSQQFTLSVTSDDHVMLVAGGGSELQPRLELYNWDAQLVRRIHLPVEVSSPVHAVVTSCGHFIVIYGWWNSKRWGICQLNGEGQRVRHFTPSTDGDDSQQLNCPWHLAVDEEDRVFVADYENNRVILLDSDLSWMKILLLPSGHDNDGLLEPWRLLLLLSSNNRKLLVVAQLHKVDVYALTQT